MPILRRSRTCLPPAAAATLRSARSWALMPCACSPAWAADPWPRNIEHPSERFTDGNSISERRLVAQCITCGTELRPERAQKYSYCMAPKCQEINAKGLAMVAIGMNKAAEEFLILDDLARDELASGKYRDQRRGSFGPAAPRAGSADSSGQLVRREQPRPRRAPAPARSPWTKSQERLALLYNEQGLRPAEIAGKLGVSPRLVTQIILAAKNRGKA